MKRLLPLLLLAPLPALVNEDGLCPPGATELQLGASAPPLEVEGGESTIAVQAGGIACVLP